MLAFSLRRANAIYQSEEHPLLLADFDRLIVGQKAGLLSLIHISIESQIEFCKYELKGGNCKEYTDKGYSGKNTDRPKFQELVPVSYTHLALPQDREQTPPPPTAQRMVQLAG